MKREKLDLAIVYSEAPARAAIAYTQNRMRAAPIEIMMEKDPEFLQAIVVNSGNANALTGQRGIEDSRSMVCATAKSLGIDEGMVGVASTGVIGRFLPMAEILAGISAATGALSHDRAAGKLAATAIITTDTTIKEAACRVTLADGTVATVGGMAKGSGMISPAMRSLHATTLSFVATDARLERRPDGRWQEALDRSFNMINVDGDQSTNDISVLMANGGAGGSAADDDPALWEAIGWVTKSLAKMVAMDGEGATKLVQVVVEGASDESEARRAARAVVSSNLVKAAIFGADPNFGRILAAIGNSGCKFDLDRMTLSMASNGTSASLFERGAPVRGSDACNPVARKVLGERNVTIKINLGVGKASAEAWGCDLTYDYVKINAQYTT